MSPTILPAITAVLTIIIGIIATQMKLEVTEAKIAYLAGGLATLIVAYLQWRENHAKTSAIKIAESRVPDITTPAGPISQTIHIVNDPASPVPPVIVSEPKAGG